MSPDTEKKEKRLETRMSAIESGLHEIKEQLGIITKKLSKAETREKEQTDRIIKIENLCMECTAIRKELDEMKVENRDLKMRVNMLERKSRVQDKIKIRNSVEIYGIPKRSNENPRKIIIEIARSANVDLEDDDFEESYRVSSADGSGKQLVAKFKSRDKKTALIKAMKIKRPRLKDINEQPENKFIYVNEMITKDTKRVLYLTKIEAKNRNWFKTWIYAGDVYLLLEEKGNQIKIENEDDLKILIN